MHKLAKVLILSLVCWGILSAASGRAETADRLSTANFHKGTILPKGTKIKITGIEAKKATFLVEPENVEFTILYDARSSMHPFERILSQMFSSKNEWMMKFSAQEQQAIREGQIVPGMRKEAVLAAYGYPPSKYTPLLQSSNTWTYFGGRYRKTIVHFDGDKVVRVEGG